MHNNRDFGLAGKIETFGKRSQILRISMNYTELTKPAKKMYSIDNESVKC
jgi:hypothetical protein